MDNKLKISPEDISILLKALEIPFEHCGSGSSHMKATLINGSEKHMIIIPYRTDVGAHYIKSLRKIFLEMSLYPKHLEDTLKNKGVLK